MARVTARHAILGGRPKKCVGTDERDARDARGACAGSEVDPDQVIRD